MDIGIFAKTFEEPSLKDVLNCVHKHGLTLVQFNMACAGLSPLPDFIAPAVVREIYEETRKRNIGIVAVSGTFNMVHPNIAEREKGLKRLHILAAACKKMGTSVITLCTGTRDANNMWKKHLENNDESAWKDLLKIMEQALRIAEECQVTLAFEPEPANVINNAEKGRKLLNEMKSDRLKVVMDAANLFEIDNISCMKETMYKAFDLLGDEIIIAHAKDIKINNEELEVVAAGKGIVDYDTYLKLLHAYGFHGALILHGLKEKEVETSVDFLKQKLQTLN